MTKVREGDKEAEVRGLGRDLEEGTLCGPHQIV